MNKIFFSALAFAIAVSFSCWQKAIAQTTAVAPAANVEPGAMLDAAALARVFVPGARVHYLQNGSGLTTDVVFDKGFEADGTIGVSGESEDDRGRITYDRGKAGVDGGALWLQWGKWGEGRKAYSHIAVSRILDGSVVYHSVRDPGFGREFEVYPPKTSN
ncbi:MAG: hypothetical protein WAN50_04500 [Minisyncoccia bacterium]